MVFGIDAHASLRSQASFPSQSFHLIKLLILESLDTAFVICEKGPSIVQNIHFTLIVPNYLEFTLDIVHQQLTIVRNVPFEYDTAFIFIKHNGHDVIIAAHSHLVNISFLLINVCFKSNLHEVLRLEVFVYVKVMNLMLIVEEQVSITQLKLVLVMFFGIIYTAHNIDVLAGNGIFLIRIRLRFNKLLLKLKVVWLLNSHNINHVSVKIETAFLDVINRSQLLIFHQFLLIFTELRQLLDFGAYVHVVVNSHFEVNSFFELLKVSNK